MEEFVNALQADGVVADILKRDGASNKGQMAVLEEVMSTADSERNAVKTSRRSRGTGYCSTGAGPSATADDADH